MDRTRVLFNVSVETELESLHGFNNPNTTRELTSKKEKKNTLGVDNTYYTHSMPQHMQAVNCGW